MNTLSMWIGIDWGSETHQVCAVDASGRPLWEEKVEHTGEAITAFCERLLQPPSTIKILEQAFAQCHVRFATEFQQDAIELNVVPIITKSSKADLC
jgi:hypothetical protein